MKNIEDILKNKENELIPLVFSLNDLKAKLSTKKDTVAYSKEHQGFIVLNKYYKHISLYA